MWDNQRPPASIIVGTTASPLSHSPFPSLYTVIQFRLILFYLRQCLSTPLVPHHYQHNHNLFYISRFSSKFFIVCFPFSFQYLCLRVSYFLLSLCHPQIMSPPKHGHGFFKFRITALPQSNTTHLSTFIWFPKLSLNCLTLIFDTNLSLSSLCQIVHLVLSYFS